MLLLAPLLTRPAFCIWILAAALLHLILTRTNFGGLGCSFHNLTGTECPGCGLTTATISLFAGDWKAGLSRHPFVPVFLAAGAAMVVSLILPPAARRAFATWVARFEARTSLALWFAGALLVHWMLRLLPP